MGLWPSSGHQRRPVRDRVDSAGLVQSNLAGSASNPAVPCTPPCGGRPAGRPGEAVRHGTRRSSSLRLNPFR